jgi:hypothetical protein
MNFPSLTPAPAKIYRHTPPAFRLTRVAIRSYIMDGSTNPHLKGVAPLSTKKNRKKKPSEPEVVGFLGVGLDNEDGHKRVTRSDNFVLVGGSEETHERMQDTAIRFDDELKQRGKSLRETSAKEVLELLARALED